MAIINLTDGNTYTFAKVNDAATILDSSDYAHARRKLRNGLELTGSLYMKPPGNGDAFRIYDDDYNEVLVSIFNNGRRGQFQLYDQSQQTAPVVRISASPTTDTIFDAGNSVAIGHNSDASTDARLYVRAEHSDNDLPIIVSDHRGSATTTYLFEGKNQGTTTVHINNGGNIYNTNGTYAQISSDERLKENIENLPNTTLDKLMNVSAVTFNWKGGYSDVGLDSDETQTGFIAQNVQTYFPDLVLPSPIKKEKIPFDDPLTINQAGFTPYLVKAIQQLNSKIEVLEARIQELENQ